MFGPEIHADTRIVHIVSTGYSSHWPEDPSHGSRKGRRPPRSCSVPS